MKIVILCSPDAFANAVKPKRLAEYFTERSAVVELLSTAGLGRWSSSGVLSKIPAPNINKLSLYILEALSAIATRSGNSYINKHVNSKMATIISKKRAVFVHKILESKAPDVIICENNSDIGFLALPRVSRIQILDLPAPYAEERYYGGSLSKKGYEKYKKYEVEMYKRADYIAFHWHTYADFVKKNKYNGSNFIDMSYGVEPKIKRAKYADNPRIIFMGLLNGYWVNLPLLSELCKRYPNIDVYGGPEPPKHYGINYKGYAPSKDVIAEYQFGLVTISDDPLRKSSFSSKHLEYLSYGLPVLTPSWRQDSLLEGGSIYYNDSDSLGEEIHEYLNADEWIKKSNMSLAIAKKMSWDNALVGLDAVLKDGGLL